MKQTNHTPTALEIAIDYQRRGWQPIPIPYRSKNPNLSGWQNFQTIETDLPSYFDGKPQNIGILLGAKSNGLTDIDLDSTEAVKIADYFLPPTEAALLRNRFNACPGSHSSHESTGTGHGNDARRFE